MSDKLEWMNRHVVLFLHRDVKDVVSIEQYKQTTELEELSEKLPQSEPYLHALEEQSRFKDACNFIAYNLHRRAAAWWGYLCVVDLLKELKQSPAKPRDIEDIGKPRPLHVPDWAKMPEPPKPEDYSKELAEMQKASEELKNAVKNNIPQDIQDTVQEAIKIVCQPFVDKFGTTPFEALERFCNNYKGENIVIDENSPIFKARDELNAKIEEARKAAIDKIKKALPPVDHVKINKYKAACLDNLYKYIVAPDHVNAAGCLNAGNQLADKPEGLASLVGFWSFGNMSTDKKMVVKTPPGLMANGLTGLLLMCALAEGGTKSFDERYKTYYDIGYSVCSGANNWGDWVAVNKIPHKELNDYEPPRLSPLGKRDDTEVKPAEKKDREHPAVERFRG